MRIVMGGVQIGATPAQVVRIAPYDTVVQEARLAVGVAAVNVLTVAAGFDYVVIVRNVSTAGQIIRVGNAPLFGGAPAGVTLNPGDTVSFDFIRVSIDAIADAAGGLLDRLIWRTSL